MYIHVHTKDTMNVGKIINRDIMLWHDEREKSNLAYLCKHDFVFKKFDLSTNMVSYLLISQRILMKFEIS